jgi:ribonuclease-3
VSQQLNYERLEWIGDAYIEIIASSFIFATFGRLKVGRCSQMRERLVCNQTLSKYFKAYNFGSRARVPSNVSIHGESKDAIKVQGDMIEAFVAAVILSDADHGVARAAKWLKALWSRTIEQEIREIEREPDLKKCQEMMQGTGAAQDDKILSKVHLATAIKVPGVEIKYEDMGPPKPDKNNRKLSLYTVGVFLTGWGEKKKLLGTGMAHSKKEAGQKAAWMALENKKMMKVYREKKSVFLASRDTESDSPANNPLIAS